MKDEDLEIAKRTWCEKAHEFHDKDRPVTNWLDSPVVQEMYINPLITGEPQIDWFQGVAVRYFSKSVERALNIGSGHGGLERHGVFIDVARQFDGYDVSPGAVELATDLAAKNGWSDRISYAVADLNKYVFPRATYDAVFASQSLHHIEALEHVFDQVQQTLKPGGLLVVNEFVGPNQFQWTHKQLHHANEQLRKIPERYRTDSSAGGIKTEITRQTIAQMNAVDPTEAIRSQDIVPLIEQRFDVLDRRDFGGTIVYLVLEGIAGNFTSAEEDRAVLRDLFSAEQSLLKSGELESDFMVLVGRRRPDAD